MPDLETIIEQAYDNAVEGIEPTETPVETPAEPVVDKSAEDVKVDDTKKPDVDEFDKDLEDAGFPKPKPGERENKLPWSRARKIFENKVTKVRTELQKTIDEQVGKLKSADDYQARIKAVDKLIATDPRRYLENLVALHGDKYRQFLTPAEVKQEVKEAVKRPNDADDPRPQPDAKFEDGSLGYSNEGLNKLLDWNARQAVKSAEAALEKKFGERLKPFEDQVQAQRLQEQRRPQIRAKLAAANETWGEDLMKTHQDEILKEMRKDDAIAQEEQRAPTPFEAIVARVLLPKIREDENSKREKILKELNERKAIVGAVPAGKKANVDENEEKSLDQIIEEAAAAAGLKWS